MLRHSAVVAALIDHGRGRRALGARTTERVSGGLEIITLF